MAPEYLHPGVYVEEIDRGPRPIEGVSTSTTGFIGLAEVGPLEEAVAVASFADFARHFGGLAADSTMSYAVRDFFANGGGQALIVRVAPADAAAGRIETALAALRRVDHFNLLCIPPLERGGATPASVYQAALALCVERRAFLIVDPDPAWGDVASDAVTRALRGRDVLVAADTPANGALYFPCLRQPDPLRGDQEALFAPSGAVAGIIARVDATRGVWKAPAGTEATIAGSPALQLALDQAEQSALNVAGINCLRVLPNVGTIVWGARTLRGADRFADQYKYVPVRRLALFLEESIHRGTAWAAFEPNDAGLWTELHRTIESFLMNLFRRGAFQGRTPREAFFVKCDAQTTTPAEVDAGVVKVEIGFAPLKPAEFVIMVIRRAAGGSRR